MVFTKSSIVAALAIASSGVVHSFSPSAPRSLVANQKNACISTSSSCGIDPTIMPHASSASSTQLNLFDFLTKEDETEIVTNGIELVDEAPEANYADEAKKAEIIALAVWGVTLSAFILINNSYGPWPLFMKSIPERTFFLSHMIGGMLFGGGIILTTCIERLVAKSNNPDVLQFWFKRVPELDGLIVVPALTISMVSGTGLSIVRYGGLNIAPPHVSAIFWTLILFLTWWAATDLTTQTTALKAVDQMYESYKNGEEGLETPKVVVDRHVSNVVSCFFVLTLYSFMVLKPGTLFPFPWSPWT